MRRSKMEIVIDLLNAIKGKGGEIKPTHLLYKSNLSHKRMTEYIEELKEKVLLKEEERKKKKVFVLTEEGYAFLENYGKLKAFTDAFGL